MVKPHFLIDGRCGFYIVERREQMFNTIDKIRFNYDYIKEDEIEGKKVQTIMIDLDIKDGDFTDIASNRYTNFAVVFDEILMSEINKLNPVGLSVTLLLPTSIIISVHFRECVDVSAVTDLLQIQQSNYVSLDN